MEFPPLSAWVHQTDWTALLILALIFIPLEHLIPNRAEQKTFRKGWLNDVFYLIFNAFPIRVGFLAALLGTMALSRAVMPGGLQAWVQDLPLLVQVVAVLVIADIGFYAAHRMFHAVPFLWRFHSVHHSIEEMDWLAAHRVHPVDQIVTMSFSLMPVYFMGFSLEAVAIYSVIYHWQSLLIHSNVRLDFGPMKWLVASPQFHHWHHANEKWAYDKNFSGQFTVIDRLLGTYHMPERMPHAYGCSDPVPDLYHQQMLYPFLPPAPAEKAKPDAQPSQTA
jgi:sterol desaturase/sphingolipid hydroxylase (fatty acid hydroxylase superfamily)